jgi:hypothetical protein
MLFLFSNIREKKIFSSPICHHRHFELFTLRSKTTGAKRFVCFFIELSINHDGNRKQHNDTLKYMQYSSRKVNYSDSPGCSALFVTRTSIQRKGKQQKQIRSDVVNCSNKRASVVAEKDENACLTSTTLPNGPKTPYLF